MRAPALFIALASLLAAAPVGAVSVVERPAEAPWGRPHASRHMRHSRDESPWDVFLTLGTSDPQNHLASRDLPLEVHPAAGIGFKYDLQPGLGVGASVGYAGVGSYREGYGRDEISHQFAEIPVLAEVTLGTPRGPLRPHVTAGAGVYIPSEWQYYTDPYENLDADHGRARWGYSVGVGAEFRSGRMGFGLDARQHFVDTDGERDARFVTVTASLHFH